MATVKKAASKRKIDLDGAAASVEKQMRDLAIKAHKANLAKNAADKEETKARAELLALMKSVKSGPKVFSDVEIDGRKVNLEAIIKRSEREGADTFALMGLVEKEVFMQCVSATKTDVIKYAGQAVFEQCKVVKEGEENVTVKPLK